MSTWRLMAETFHQPTRMKYGDAVADAAWPFRVQGYELLPPIPREVALELGAWLKALPTKDEGTLGYYETMSLLGSEMVKEIVTSVGVWMRAGMWLGAPPVLMDVAAWVSRPGGAEPEGAQMWHRDMDDWRAVKLFVYLSDVTHETGPHQYIAGSHRASWFEERGSPPDPWFLGSGRGNERMTKALDGLPRVEFVGEAGTCFLENTHGFHRGLPPVKGERILLQALYALTEYEGAETKRAAIKEAWGV